MNKKKNSFSGASAPLADRYRYRNCMCMCVHVYISNDFLFIYYCPQVNAKPRFRMQGFRVESFGLRVESFGLRV
jgi:hypothetical protein